MDSVSSPVPGRFNDGETPVEWPVEVRLDPHGLAIIDDNSRAVLARWSYGEVRVIEGKVWRLRHGAEPGRLSIDRPDAIAALLTHMPHLTHPGRRINGRMVAASVGAVLVVVGIVLGLPLLVRPVAQMVPVAWEKSWGDAALTQFTAFAPSCQRPDGAQALSVMVGRVMRGAKAATRVQVHVVESKTSNAFALPGGHVVVLGGLLKQARSADEVAAVLAHEIAHVELRHATERSVRDMGLGLVVSLLTGDVSGTGAGVVSSLLSFSYSRADEAAADARGREILAQAGLSTLGVAPFFRRLAEDEGDMPEWLSTHPDSANRAAKAERDARPGQSALSPGDFRALQGICG